MSKHRQTQGQQTEPGQAERGSEAEKNFGLERLVFFSDAVFAIAITLLALDIRLPEMGGIQSDAALRQALLSLWPQYFAYMLSFLVIGASWANHHRRFGMIRRYDRTLIFLNLLLLMAIAFVPFPTSVLAEFGNQTAVTLYALTMAVAALMSGLGWWYAIHDNRLVDASLDAHTRRRETISIWIVAAVFVLSIGIATVSPRAATFSWILTAAGPLVVRWG
jgi:uncharacterized membrane protein